MCKESLKFGKEFIDRAVSVSEFLIEGLRYKSWYIYPLVEELYFLYETFRYKFAWCLVFIYIYIASCPSKYVIIYCVFVFIIALFY